MDFEKLISEIHDLKMTLLAVAIAQASAEAMRLNPHQDPGEGLRREARAQFLLIGEIRQNLDKLESQ